MLDWKVGLAALALVAVLAGGTVLSAQVERDLDAHIDVPPMDTGSPGGSPLKLNDFKLPSNLPLTLPKGADVSPDLSKLTLPKDLNVTIPPGMNLSGMDLKIPKDLKLDLPPGSNLDGTNLTLPQGANITLPDGSGFSLPPGTKLDLPPELAKRLLDQGLPSGTLPQGASFDLHDLPPGLQAQLAGAAMSAGGALTLPSGTTIQLPPGMRFGDLAGPLAFALPYVLPPGTTLGFPADATNVPIPSGAAPGPDGASGSACTFSGDYQRCSFRCNAGDAIFASASSRIGGDYPRTRATCGGIDGYCQLPGSCSAQIGNAKAAGAGVCVSETVRNAGGCRAVPRAGSPATLAGIAIRTDINPDSTPIRKDEPTTINGYVQELASARPIAGAPVEIYLNQTKATPGDLLGTTTSDAAGHFSYTFTFPADKPAGSWQLVNHVPAFRAASGAQYATGWGDPERSVFANTNLTLVLDAVVSRGAPFSVQGVLRDTSGAAVAGQPIGVFADGAYVASATTDASGAWGAMITFNAAGNHSVTAQFSGVPNTLGSSHATKSTTAADIYTLQADPLVSVPRGTTALIHGRVMGSGSGAAGETVRVTSPWGGDVLAGTASDGSFTLSIPVPRSETGGAAVVSVTDPARSLIASTTLDVWIPGALTVDVAGGASRFAFNPNGIPVDVRLVDDVGSPLAAQPISFQLTGPGGATAFKLTTDAFGKASANGPNPPSWTDGRYFATVTAVSPNVHAPAALASFTAGTLDAKWDVPANALRNHAIAVSTLVTLAGQPLANEPVSLTMFGDHAGRTDANGHVAWTLTVPATTPLGVAQARLSLANFPASQFTTSTIIQAVPKLNVSSGEADYDPASGVDVKVTLKDDQDAPMRDRPVQVHLAAGSWSDDEIVTTDASGQWTGHIDTKAAPRANLTLTATHAALDTAVPASDLRSVPVRTQSAVVAPQPGGLPTWMIFGLAAIVVGGGGAGLVYALRRKPGQATVPLAAAPTVMPAAVLAADFDLVFGIPPGEPAVWGVREPLEIQIRAKPGRAQPGSHVLLESGATRGDIMLDDEGEGHVTIVPEREGEQIVRATREGEVAESRLRVVEYRKAVAEEFEAFVARAALVDRAIDRQSTPREVQFILAARLGADAENALDQMASIMERTNYSLAPVGRSDYLDFHAARRALEALLPGA